MNLRILGILFLTVTLSFQESPTERRKRQWPAAAQRCAPRNLLSFVALARPAEPERAEAGGALRVRVSVEKGRGVRQPVPLYQSGTALDSGSEERAATAAVLAAYPAGVRHRPAPAPAVLVG